MFSLYLLKPRFQEFLVPIAAFLYRSGISANCVTIATMTASVGVGIALWTAGPTHPRYFLLLPPWMFFRMGLNAIDGVLAVRFDQKTPLGAYLNEMSDVVSDAALYLPFTLISPFGAGSIGLVIFLACLSEMSGLIGPLVGAPRQYQGPMGKSDRACIFGVLGLWLGISGALPDPASWLVPLIAAGIFLNIVNRVRGGLKAIPG